MFDTRQRIALICFFDHCICQYVCIQPHFLEYECVYVYVYVMSQCGSYLQSFSLFLVNASSFINMFVAAVFIIFIPGKRIRLSVNDWRAKGTEQRRAEEPIQHMTRKHFYISYYSMCGVPHTIKAHFLLPSNTRWFYCLVLETNQPTDQPRLNIFLCICIYYSLYFLRMYIDENSVYGYRSFYIGCLSHVDVAMYVEQWRQFNGRQFCIVFYGNCLVMVCNILLL